MAENNPQPHDMELPDTIDVASFDALHDDPARWRHVVESIAADHASAPVKPMTAGTVLVGLVGQELVVKLYPPFLRDHFEFEREALARLHGHLSVPTPRLVASGDRDGWPYLVMTQLAGPMLSDTWPTLTEVQRCSVLSALGQLEAEVHALPPAELDRLAPDWAVFVQGQRGRCLQRQQRTGLPAHLLVQLGTFIAGALPNGRHVILTGEYTPTNLLHGAAGLLGMFDFGDGLVGPREYDWLGPLCFLAAGNARRCDAFFSAYGHTPDGAERLSLMRLLLLHRYSHLPAQIAHPGWQQAESFEALTVMVWP